MLDIFGGKKSFKNVNDVLSFYSVLAVCMLSHFIVPTVGGWHSFFTYVFDCARSIALAHDRQLQVCELLLVACGILFWTEDGNLGPPALGVQSLWPLDN